MCAGCDAYDEIAPLLNERELTGEEMCKFITFLIIGGVQSNPINSIIMLGTVTSMVTELLSNPEPQTKH